MIELANRELSPYRKGEEPLTAGESAELLGRLSGWKIVERDAVLRLEKSFAFLDFQEALDFTNLVGRLAAACDHHPAILISWGRTAVSWWTHAVGGLHRNDFIMAARTDLLSSEGTQPSGEESV